MTRSQLCCVVRILQFLSKPFVSGEQRSVAAPSLPGQAGGQRPGRAQDNGQRLPRRALALPPGARRSQVIRSNSPNLAYPSL